MNLKYQTDCQGIFWERVRNFILYASPGKEGFYKKLNFKRMKTGMAYFTNPRRMVDGGFVEDE